MRSEPRNYLRLSCQIWIEEVKEMRKIKQLLFLMSLIAAAGLTYTIVTLKNFPETFDWDTEEEIDNEF